MLTAYMIMLVHKDNAWIHVDTEEEYSADAEQIVMLLLIALNVFVLLALKEIQCLLVLLFNVNITKIVRIMKPVIGLTVYVDPFVKKILVQIQLFV